jgi:hypothetical protein
MPSPALLAAQHNRRGEARLVNGRMQFVLNTNSSQTASSSGSKPAEKFVTVTLPVALSSEQNTRWFFRRLD